MRWVRVLGVAIASLVVLLAIAAGLIFAISEFQIGRKYDVQVATLEVRTDATALAQGQHVATIRGCRDCHKPDLAGAILVEDPFVGRVGAPNLTPGRSTPLTDEDFVRAVRHGLRRDGTSLLIMPSHEYWHLSDSDLSALLAYVRSVPAVERETPPRRIALPIRAIFLFSGDEVALLPAALIDHDAPRPESPREGDVQALGKYLAVTCTGCHGKGLGGGVIPGVGPNWPAASNLTPAGNLVRWTHEQFVTALRSGRTPEGRQLDPRYMPWPQLGTMTDAEMSALWDYLRAVPARETGTR